jgi:hypothetical protein
MARHESNSDLSTLAATLTPRVSRPPLESARKAQSSGMFDMSAMYSQPDRGGRRAEPRRLPKTRTAPPPLGPPPARRPSWPQRLGWDEPIAYGEAEVEVEVDTASSFVSAWPAHPPPIPPAPPSSHPPPVAPVWPWTNTRQWPPGPIVISEMAELEVDVSPEPGVWQLPAKAPSLGLGWYAVFVAWLGTLALGGLLATSLPGHVLPRARVLAAAPPPPPTAIAPATPPPVVAAAAMAAPMPAPSNDGIPEINASMLPIATTAAPHAVPAVAPAPRPVAPRPPAVVAPVPAAPAPVVRKAAPARPAPAVEEAAPAPHAKPQPAPPAVAAAPAPAPTTAPAPAPAPAKPVSTANMSLEDLIRHEVQAEQAKQHH